MDGLEGSSEDAPSQRAFAVWISLLEILLGIHPGHGREHSKLEDMFVFVSKTVYKNMSNYP